MKMQGWQRAAAATLLLAILVVGSVLLAYALRDKYPKPFGKLVDITRPYTNTARVSWLKDEMRIVYPWAARRQNQEGSVILALTIEQDGRISSSRIDQGSGNPLLDDAALAAAEDFEADTAQLGAVQFPFEKKMRMTFRLEDPASP